MPLKYKKSSFLKTGEVFKKKFFDTIKYFSPPFLCQNQVCLKDYLGQMEYRRKEHLKG